MSFIEIKGIKKHYGEGESRVDVLNGIDIEIEKGEIVVLLGPSGSGKSTLLNQILKKFPLLLSWQKRLVVIILK